MGCWLAVVPSTAGPRRGAELRRVEADLAEFGRQG